MAAGTPLYPIYTGVNVGVVRVVVGLHMAACFAFSVMILSALAFHSVKRHPVWYNFCISWIFFTLSYSLLAFSGQQFSEPTERSQQLCAAQAVMVHTAPFFAGFCSLSLILQLLLNLLSVLPQLSDRTQRTFPIITAISLVLPWAVTISIMIPIIAFVISYPKNVEMSKTGTTCLVLNSPLGRLSAIGSVVIAVAVIALEAFIGFLFYRYRQIKALFKQSYTLAIRVFIFTTLALIAASVGLIFASSKTRGPAFDLRIDLLLSILPISTAIIFGSQMDLWEGYRFWKRKTTATGSRSLASPPETPISLVSARMSKPAGAIPTIFPIEGRYVLPSRVSPPF